MASPESPGPMDVSGPPWPGVPLSPSPVRPRLAPPAPGPLAFVWRDLVGENAALEAGEAARKQLSNFFRVPLELEKVLGVIFLVLLDHLLFVFAVLPLRILIFLPLTLAARSLSPRRVYDVVKLGIIVVTSLIISHYFDFGVSYHNVKAQSTIKIYVIVNVLEVVDKIFSSFGNEIFDLVRDAVRTVCTRELRTVRSGFQLLLYTIMALVYSVLHALVLFFQWVTLSVAINFSNSALVTVLISNNFMELKSQVFKRVSPENLVQLTYGDGVERLQLFVFLCLITVHNLSDIGLTALWHAGSYLALVLGSEIFVDWFKHSFVIKFNSLSASYYSDGAALVIRDALDRSDDSSLGLENAAKRVGFVDVPFAVIILKLLVETKVFHYSRYAWFIPLGLVGAAFVARTLVHCLLLMIRHLRNKTKRQLFTRKASTRDLDNNLMRNSVAEKKKED